MPAPPSKRTPDRVARILTDLAMGYTLRAAAGGAGVSHVTVGNWAKLDPELREALDVAILAGQRVLETEIRDEENSSKHNARRWRLQAMDPDGWSERQVRVDGGRLTFSQIAKEAVSDSNE